MLLLERTAVFPFMWSLLFAAYNAEEPWLSQDWGNIEGEESLFLKFLRPDKIMTSNSGSKSDFFRDLTTDLKKIKWFPKRSSYHGSNGGHCTCGAQYQMRELGRHFYPRYIPHVYCERKSCWDRSHTCQQSFYKVKVLRRRNHTLNEVADSFIPDSLRSDWVFEEFPVAVSCECTA